MKLEFAQNKANHLSLLILFIGILFISGCASQNAGNKANQTGPETTSQPAPGLDESAALPGSVEPSTPIEEPRPTVELTSWNIIGGDSYVLMIIKYCSTKTSKQNFERFGISLIDPEGNLVDESSTSAGVCDYSSMTMTDGKYAIPPAGTYKIIMDDDKGVIFEKDLIISDANVRIEKIGPKWFYSEYWGNALQNACVNFVNDGNLPANLQKLPINVGGKEVTDGVGIVNLEGNPAKSWIEHGTGTFCVYGYSNVFVAGEQVLSIAGYDFFGKVVAEKQMKISLPLPTKK